jgi:hypothetical protein
MAQGSDRPGCGATVGGIGVFGGRSPTATGRTRRAVDETEGLPHRPGEGVDDADLLEELGELGEIADDPLAVLRVGPGELGAVLDAELVVDLRVDQRIGDARHDERGVIMAHRFRTTWQVGVGPLLVHMRREGHRPSWWRVEQLGRPARGGPGPSVAGGTGRRTAATASRCTPACRPDG